MSISLSKVAKSFGVGNVVDGVSLDIAAGEFFVVLGPSGCGKTTLLRLVAGLEKADSGDIVLAGDRVSGGRLHVPPEERNVGFVFQSYALWPHMSVAENVAFPLQAAGTKKANIDRMVAQCLQTVELAALADRKPANLSGGQRQRVALARCLAQQAGIVLMDEPLANLDPHLRSAMEEELAQFHKTIGATTLYITHDQREAMALADRLAVMWDGSILQVATPDEIYRRPANQRVASFIGRSAILAGIVTSVDGTMASVKIGDHSFVAECGPDTAAGACNIVVRPEDLVAEPSDSAVAAAVIAIAYRGGFWEVSACVDGFQAPLMINMPDRVQVGSSLAITIKRAWVLPNA